jgi:hypothetical protein
VYVLFKNYCLKYFGLVVGQPFFDEAQELNKAVATKRVRKNRAIFFMLGV